MEDPKNTKVDISDEEIEPPCLGHMISGLIEEKEWIGDQQLNQVEFKKAEMNLDSPTLDIDFEYKQELS